MINHKEIDPYNEEIWEEDVIVKENNDTIILENVKIEGNFDCNYIRGLYGQMIPGRFDREYTITFNSDIDKNNFLNNYRPILDFRNKLNSVIINRYDKKGFLLEKINLYGVILTSVSYGDNDNITVRCDYWVKEYV